MAKSLLLIATLSSIAAAAGVEREFFTAEFATAVQKLRESYELLPSPHSVTQLSYRENHVWCAQEPLRRLRDFVDRRIYEAASRCEAAATLASAARRLKLGDSTCISIADRRRDLRCRQPSA